MQLSHRFDFFVGRAARVCLPLITYLRWKIGALDCELMKHHFLCFVAFFFSVRSFAQSVPDIRFDGHTLGETAETFFSTATMTDVKTATREYCKTLLNDPEALPRYEETKTATDKKDFLFSDVPGCRAVMAALQGERTQVGARFASELSKGRAQFDAGKLVSLTLFTEFTYPKAVGEMTKRFRSPGSKYVLPSRQAKGGAEAMRWREGGVTAVVFKLPYEDRANIYVGYGEFGD
jgi:hypothetical protein